jgi:hypothetical protein
LVNGRSSRRRDSANAILGNVFSNYIVSGGGYF